MSIRRWLRRLKRKLATQPTEDEDVDTTPDPELDRLERESHEQTMLLTRKTHDLTRATAIANLRKIHGISEAEARRRYEESRNENGDPTLEESTP